MHDPVASSEPSLLMIPAPFLERLKALSRQYDFSAFFLMAASLAAESLNADVAAFIVH